MRKLEITVIGTTEASILKVEVNACVTVTLKFMQFSNNYMVFKKMYDVQNYFQFLNIE